MLIALWKAATTVIDISYTQMRLAILDGYDLGGNWQVCRKDGAVYWHHRYLPSQHTGHIDVPIPALYAEGVASQRRLFLSWLHALPDRQRMAELETFLYPDGAGIVYALPCVVEHILSETERASWLSLKDARIMMIAEGTLQMLNAPHGRPRYRYATIPSALTLR